MTSIFAVILNWNELDMTIRCLKSLLRQERVSCDILVMDNHSKEDPTLKLKKVFPTVRVLRNNENLGVAGARNIGIRYAIEKGYDFILLFDNDAHADPHMLFYLLQTAERNPNAGIFGPKILRDDRLNVIWRAGCTSWKWTYLHTGSEIFNRLFRILGKDLPPFLDTKRGMDKLDNGKYDEEINMAFQIGCIQFIRAEVFRRVGLLDEDFSPYSAEDIDFCARAKRAGWRIRYVPKALCWHREGGSFQNEYHRSYCTVKNLILLARKNLSSPYFWFLFFPDFIFMTVPLFILECTVKRTLRRRKALLDAIIWNLKDVRRRGILIGDRRNFGQDETVGVKAKLHPS